MKSQISPLILSELRERADCIDETNDTPGETQLLRLAIEQMEAGNKPTGPLLNAVREEMLCLETMDRFFEIPINRRQLLEAQAWLGMLDIYNPKTQYSKRPRTAGIDGIRYEV